MLIMPVDKAIMTNERVSNINYGIWKEVKGRIISSPYGERDSGDGFHDGIDILPVNPYISGDNIYAAHDGIVSYVGELKGYGNTVIIDGEGFSTLYGHLNDFDCKVGQSATQGDIIGHMGNTGTTGVHLHFEYRDEEYLRPRTSLGKHSYWSTHDGEFYSSRDPLKYIKEEAKKADVSIVETDKTEIDLIAEIKEKYSELGLLIDKL